MPRERCFEGHAPGWINCELCERQGAQRQELFVDEPWRLQGISYSRTDRKSFNALRATTEWYETLTHGRAD